MMDRGGWRKGETAIRPGPATPVGLSLGTDAGVTPPATWAGAAGTAARDVGPPSGAVHPAGPKPGATGQCGTEALPTFQSLNSLFNLGRPIGIVNERQIGTDVFHTAVSGRVG